MIAAAITDQQRVALADLTYQYGAPDSVAVDPGSGLMVAEWVTAHHAYRHRYVRTDGSRVVWAEVKA